MDFYQTLGVTRNSSADEIKQAYRRLAAKHHPDRGGDPEKFKEIQIAYDTLSDLGKKQQYDNPMPEHGFFHFDQGQHDPHFQHVFTQFFGGGGAGSPFDFFGSQFRNQPQRNKTINLSAEISLEEAFYGKELMFNVILPTGRNQAVNIKIPPGVNDGTVLRVSQLGDDSFPNVPRGDIHLTIAVRPHQYYNRQGDDLIKDLNISAIDAMLGTKLTVNTIDGKTIEVNVNPGIQHGQVLSAAGYGMPNVSDNRFRGRFLMPVNIVIPTNLSQSQKDLLENFNKV